MKPPCWLEEFHRQWQAARGRKAASSTRAFARDWPDLLENAGVRAEDQAAAIREAETLENQERILLKRHRYRHYLIERVVLPLESESWLRTVFGSDDAAELQQRSLALLVAESQRGHPLFPELWKQWCERVRAAFAAGQTQRPLSWREPENVKRIVDLIHALTARVWPSGTPIRSASVTLGLDSKALERHRRSVESALSNFFGRPTALEALGIVGSPSHIWLSGPLILHFEDGTTLDYAASRDRYIVTYAELLRTVAVSTPVQRLLSVENEKETFRRLAAANLDRRTLLVASSFPAQAMRLLLEKLPLELPHFHFGDTDPEGWHILLKLREVTPRRVIPFLMQYRSKFLLSPYTEYDRMVMSKLLVSPLLEDCAFVLNMMQNAGSRGDFEQETLGPPTSNGWPFFSDVLL
jgi:hypothetical protein